MIKLVHTNLTAACCLVALLAPAAAAQEGPFSDNSSDRSERELVAKKHRSLEQMVKLGRSDDRFGARPVLGAPYSAEQVVETVHTLADGTQIRREKRVRIYRDSQGRTRREESAAESPGPEQEDRNPMILISDPVARRNYVIDPRKKLIVELEGPRHDEEGEGEGDRRLANLAAAREREQESRRRREADSDRPAAGVESLGKRMIEGVEADGTRRTSVIAAGRIGNDREIRTVYERWRSAELQVTVMTKRSDPRSGERIYRLTNIQRNEPLPMMFRPPADYERLSTADEDHREERGI